MRLFGGSLPTHLERILLATCSSMGFLCHGVWHTAMVYVLASESWMGTGGGELAVLCQNRKHGDEQRLKCPNGRSEMKWRDDTNKGIIRNLGPDRRKRGSSTTKYIKVPGTDMGGVGCRWRSQVRGEQANPDVLDHL